MFNVEAKQRGYRFIFTYCQWTGESTYLEGEGNLFSFGQQEFVFDTIDEEMKGK